MRAARPRDAVLDLGGIAEIAQLEGGRSGTVCVMGESRIRAICTYMRDDQVERIFFRGHRLCQRFCICVGNGHRDVAPEEAGRRCFPAELPTDEQAKLKGHGTGSLRRGPFDVRVGAGPGAEGGGEAGPRVSGAQVQEKRPHLSRRHPRQCMFWPCLRF